MQGRQLGQRDQACIGDLGARLEIEEAKFGQAEQVDQTGVADVRCVGQAEQLEVAELLELDKPRVLGVRGSVPTRTSSIRRRALALGLTSSGGAARTRATAAPIAHLASRSRCVEGDSGAIDMGGKLPGGGRRGRLG